MGTFRRIRGLKELQLKQSHSTQHDASQLSTGHVTQKRSGSLQAEVLQNYNFPTNSVHEAALDVLHCHTARVSMHFSNSPRILVSFR